MTNCQTMTIGPYYVSRCRPNDRFFQWDQANSGPSLYVGCYDRAKMPPRLIAVEAGSYLNTGRTKCETGARLLDWCVSQGGHAQHSRAALMSTS